MEGFCVEQVRSAHAGGKAFSAGAVKTVDVLSEERGRGEGGNPSY